MLSQERSSQVGPGGQGAEGVGEGGEEREGGGEYKSKQC